MLLFGLAGKNAAKLRHLGAQTAHFHNLTKVLADELAEFASVEAPVKRRGGSSNRRERHQLSNSVDASPNLAVFQVTAELPLSLDFVFTGSLPSNRQVILLNICHFSLLSWIIVLSPRPSSQQS